MGGIVVRPDNGFYTIGFGVNLVGKPEDDQKNKKLIYNHKFLKLLKQYYHVQLKFELLNIYYQEVILYFLINLS